MYPQQYVFATSPRHNESMIHVNIDSNTDSVLLMLCCLRYCLPSKQDLFLKAFNVKLVFTFTHVTMKENQRSRVTAQLSVYTHTNDS